MVGMTEDDMQACAGLPDKMKKFNEHVTLYEYQRGRNIGTAATSTLIPVQSVQNIISSMGGGDGKSCVADFRVVDGRVQDVYYSGDNDMLIGTDGVCATVVRGCVRQTVPSGRPPKGWISAFMEPQLDHKTEAGGTQAKGSATATSGTEAPRLLNTTPASTNNTSASAPANASTATIAAKTGQ